MVSAHDLFKDVLAMRDDGAKPFKIVKHVLMKVDPAHVAVSGTLNDARLIFTSGEEISFDGSDWCYHAPEPDPFELDVQTG